MEHIAQGKRSDTLGFPHSRVSAPCKGKSFNPLCCYSYLIADLAVLKWNIVCIFCSIPAPCLKAFALTGRDCSNTRYPGCRFACPGLCAPLGFQPALVKSETLGHNGKKLKKVWQTYLLTRQLVTPLIRQPVTLLTRKRTKPINKCHHYFYYNTPAC